MPPELTEQERCHLERCVELAEQALSADDEPFGSVLVSVDGRTLAEGAQSGVGDWDRTQHPEIALARWAAQHLSPQERAGGTVSTSGEPCRCAPRDVPVQGPVADLAPRSRESHRRFHLRS